MQDDPRKYVPRTPGKLFAIGSIGAVVLTVCIAAALVWARSVSMRREADTLEQEAAQGQRVLVVRVQHAPPSRSLDVPASIRGFVETPIYAKIAGYLKSIEVDKGDRVKEGQILAVLESPEIDQQVANARANYQLQSVTNERNQTLVRQALIAQQVADESRSAMLQAKAMLDQLEATQAYKVIRAPFSGIVTARFVDPGVLIPQATTPSAGSPILTLATLSPVRVYANVPQSVAPLIQNGDPATISVTEYPGRPFKGSVTRHPEALQPATRTMLVEVDVPNEDFALYPGMYASVRFTVAQPAGPARVPDDALIFRGGKVYVPVVHENRLALSEVNLGYDDGRMVEITAGVGDDDLVAINVGQAVRDGQVVQPISAEGP
ncbi:MAG TPA: efflux RND transporter periplasmic adaptor subunit [Candidatus Margulisiibacteriota bacterium]|nr:efflux RND transporter periplasmic adaptor subunit [Candidatus Margulisiibacteriota bacterium]